jgi:hypothetical protein
MPALYPPTGTDRNRVLAPETWNAVARCVDDKPVAEVVRAAIDEHIAARRRDEQFRRTLRERIQKADKLLGS